MARAADLRRSGELAAAAELLGQRLADVPDDVDAQHLMARVQIAAGRPGLASLMLSGVRVVRPDDADVAASLARALVGEGDLGAAGLEATRAVELGPRASRSHRAVGYVAAARGDQPAAAAAFARAIELDPTHLGARINLVGVLFVAGRDEAAVAAIADLAEHDEDVVTRVANLAVRLDAAGRADQARAALAAGLRSRPGDPELEHLLAAHEERGPERASDAYLRQHFDRFAASFDDTLGRLGYETPAALARLVRDAGARDVGTALDLGCGTGLAADLLRPSSERLVGVDLSAGMVDRAAARGIYDELHVAEAGRWCDDHPDAHDLVFAADVLNYFGELEPIIGSIARALRPGGLLAASFERGGEEGGHLAGNGRWTHGEQTVREAGAAAGLELVATSDSALRREAGTAVAGLLVLWRRPGQPTF